MAPFVSRSHERQRLIHLKADERRYQTHLTAMQERLFLESTSYPRAPTGHPRPATSHVAHGAGGGVAGAYGGYGAYCGRAGNGGYGGHAGNGGYAGRAGNGGNGGYGGMHPTRARQVEGNARMSARTLAARLGSHRRAYSAATGVPPQRGRVTVPAPESRMLPLLLAYSRTFATHTSTH